MKPGPVLAMLALIFVGVWLVLQPTLEQRRRIDPEALRFAISLGARTIAIEQRTTPGGEDEFHAKGWPGVDELGWIDREQFHRLLTEEVRAWEARPAWERTLLGFFNISGWFNMSWIALGLLGQCAFFGRMMLQWVVSEKSRRSVVPAAFWWMSLLGGVCLFSYFVWRVDIIGVLGQSTGVVIYARNIRLIHKRKRRANRAATARSAAGRPPGSD
jgi:lipid-A-disaccharide synthase-like uncharacterized protein